MLNVSIFYHIIFYCLADGFAIDSEAFVKNEIIVFYQLGTLRIIAQRLNIELFGSIKSLNPWPKT